jgi:nitrous oxidase accessory protein
MMRVPVATAFFAFAAASMAASAGSVQALIDAAPAGSTLEVPGGVYRERIVIAKPITIVGRNLPVLDGGGEGKVVEIRSDHVTLRGFRIKGSGLALFEDDAAVFVTGHHATIEENRIEDSLHGIYLKKAADCRLLNNRIIGKTAIATEIGSIEAGMGVSPENCDSSLLVANRRGNGIHLWNCARTAIHNNHISEVRDGIYFSFANQTECTGNLVTRVRYGLHYMYSDDNSFVANSFSDNDAGAALMFSKRLVIRGNNFVSNQGFRAYGLIFQSMDDCRLESNIIRKNAVGLSMNQCNRNRILGNRVDHNYIGLKFGSNSDENAFSTNVFEQNLHPVELAGENGSNQWALAGVGNHWEGAIPFDLDQDGRNDLPHRELDLLGPLRRDFPTVALLSESPLLKVLRFAHQRAALPGVSSVEDPRPLSRNFPGLRYTAGSRAK